MKIHAVIDDKPVIADLTEVAPRQLPYAMAAMLTRMARDDVRPGFQARLPQVFDRPTEFTQRGVFMQPASTRELESSVYFPQSDDEAGKAQREYLRPGAEGATARNQKKTEYLLSRLGALPPGWVTTPGKGAPLNAYGNIEGSVYRQIINVLQIRYNNLKPVSARSQKAAQKLGVQALFFVVSPGANKLGKNGGWLPPGVWKHLPGHGITQILKFVRKASYRPRLDVKAEGTAIVQKVLPDRWREAVLRIAEKFAARGR